MKESNQWAKVSRNRSTYQVNIPITMIREIGLDENKEIEVRRYYTKGAGKQIILRFRHPKDNKTQERP